jgi:hypothetical protein
MSDPRLMQLVLRNLLEMPWKFLLQKEYCDQHVSETQLEMGKTLGLEKGSMMLSIEKLVDEAWKEQWEKWSAMKTLELLRNIPRWIYWHKWTRYLFTNILDEILRDDPEYKWRMMLVKAWLTIIQSFLLAMFFSIRNNASTGLVVWKKRLKSTSVCMPWSIAPALLVLWSVVWMFRPASNGTYESFYNKKVPTSS